MNTCYYCNCNLQEETEVCSNCQRKIKAVKIIQNNPELKEYDKFTKDQLIDVGINNPIVLQHDLWILEEVGLLEKNNNLYRWKNLNLLDMYIQKYSLNQSNTLNLSNVNEYGWAVYHTVDENHYDIYFFDDFVFADEFKKSQEHRDDFRLSRIRQLNDEERIFNIINLKKFYVNKEYQNQLYCCPVYDEKEIKRIYDNNLEPLDNLSFTKEVKIKEVIERMEKHLKDTVEVLDRPAEEGDVSHEDVYKNFSSYLKKEYNETISKELFENYFTSVLFKIYPYSDRRYINNSTHFNIRLNHVCKSNEGKSDYGDGKSVNIQIILAELLNSILVKSDTGHLTYIDIYDLAKKRIMDEYQFKLNQNDFSVALDIFVHEKNILKQITDGQISYNLEMTAEEEENHERETEEDNFELNILTLEKQDSSLIFIKTVIDVKDYNTLLDLLYYTSENTRNVLIYKTDSQQLEVSIELEVENENKEKLMETIEQYS